MFETKYNLIQIVYENCYWDKSIYDHNNNEMYFETSDGYWAKKVYDKEKREIYYEDSYGTINDYRNV